MPKRHEIRVFRFANHLESEIYLRLPFLVSAPRDAFPSPFLAKLRADRQQVARDPEGPEEGEFGAVDFKHAAEAGGDRQGGDAAQPQGLKPALGSDILKVQEMENDRAGQGICGKRQHPGGDNAVAERFVHPGEHGAKQRGGGVPVSALFILRD